MKLSLPFALFTIVGVMPLPVMQQSAYGRQLTPSDTPPHIREPQLKAFLNAPTDCLFSVRLKAPKRVGIGAQKSTPGATALCLADVTTGLGTEREEKGCALITLGSRESAAEIIHAMNPSVRRFYTQGKPCEGAGAEQIFAQFNRHEISYFLRNHALADPKSISGRTDYHKCVAEKLFVNKGGYRGLQSLRECSHQNLFTTKLKGLLGITTRKLDQRSETSSDNPKGRVVDEPKILSDKVRSGLERLLAEHEKLTTEQVVIAVFRSLEGEDLLARTGKIFSQWRIGQPGVNNGVLLALYWEDRKARLEVGYGLEWPLTDTEAKRVLEESLIPGLREGDPGRALQKAVIEILSVLDSPLMVKNRAQAILSEKPSVHPRSH